MEPGCAFGGSPNVSGPAITMPPGSFPVRGSFSSPPAGQGTLLSLIKR